MALYEVVREIQNECARNHMRDVFFDEIETDDPRAYVAAIEKDIELVQSVNDDGDLVILAEKDQYRAQYTFTEI